MTRSRPAGRSTSSCSGRTNPLGRTVVTVYCETQAQRAPNAFGHLGFKHLVDIEGVTGSIPVAPTIQFHRSGYFSVRFGQASASRCKGSDESFDLCDEAGR